MSAATADGLGSSPSDDSAFWAEYAVRYGPELAKDGAGRGYGEARPRVLAVLKDPDNSPGADLRHDFLDGGAKWAIWHRLAEWVAGIQHTFPPYENVCGQTEIKNEALRNSAVINVKKRSGGSSIDDATLHRYAFQDRALLREQIKTLDPVLILACGTFEQLLWILGDLVPTGANLELPHPVIRLTNGATLVKWRHPARCPGRAAYDQLREVFATGAVGDLAQCAHPGDWQF